MLRHMVAVRVVSGQSISAVARLRCAGRAVADLVLLISDKASFAKPLDTWAPCGPCPPKLSVNTSKGLSSQGRAALSVLCVCVTQCVLLLPRRRVLWGSWRLC
jgi:hypothetical protein